MRTEKIPSELQTLPQWVNWKKEVRNGKPTKIPINPHTLGNAATDKPSTWGTFEKAASNIREGLGIGFVVTDSDPFTGGDLDKCVNPETGEIEAWALDMIKSVGSYAEISPSETGMRIFVKAKLPEGKRKIGRVEIYDSGRFLTLTGQILAGYTEIKFFDGEKLYRLFVAAGEDLKIIDKAIAATNGDKFRALWNGDWSEYPSQSEADMALVSILFFYTKDKEWTDRLFRKSGLFRQKWDEKHFADGRTYGQKLVEEVSRSSTIDSDWPEIIPLDDFSRLPAFPVEVLPAIGREFVEHVVEVNQVDTGLPASIYLAILAACAAKKFEVDLITHREPVNLFICPVLDSGNRKTTTMSNMTSPLYEYQKQKAEDMKDEIMQATNLYEINKDRLAKLQKMAAQTDDSTERIRLQKDAEAVLKLIEENPVPKAPVYVVDDITSEATGVIMSENGERLADISAEGGIFGIMAGRYNEKGGNFDIYLKGHAGDPFSMHRIGREAKHMLAPALTMCLTVQHDVINEIGSNRQFRGRGLLARFLYSHCKTQVGYRKRQNMAIPDVLITRYNTHIQTLADTPLNLQTLTLTPEAQVIWDEFYNDIEIDMQPGKPLEMIKDWGSKLPGAVARIAGLLHFAEYGSKAGEKVISAGIVGASCVIGAYYREHAIATFELMQEDPRIESAKRILEFISHHRPEIFKGRDVLRYKNALKTMDDVNPGLKILIEMGYIREVKPVMSIGIGRPEAPSFEVNPKINILRNQRQ